MPLSQVQRGMHCTALSVIRGTDISSFDAEVARRHRRRRRRRRADPRSASAGRRSTRPASGPGFSGSPIYCPDGDGVSRVIGAISEGDRRLRQQGRARDADRADARRAVRRRRPRAGTRPRAAAPRRSALALPLTHQRRRAPVAAVFRAARPPTPGARCSPAPPAPRAAVPAPARCVPGSAFVGRLLERRPQRRRDRHGHLRRRRPDLGLRPPAGLASGAARCSCRTPTSTTIVNNPLGIADVTTYKLAAPGARHRHADRRRHRRGDRPHVGRAAADAFPLTVFALDQDTGNRVVAALAGRRRDRRRQPDRRLAASGLVGRSPPARPTYEVLRGSPRARAAACACTITIAERAKPMGFCNTYVGGAPGAGRRRRLARPCPTSARRSTLLDGYQLGPLHVTSVAIDLRARRGLAQAFLARPARPAPRAPRATLPLHARLRRVGGAKLTRTIRVHVSRGVHPGFHELVLHGTSPDSSGAPSDEDLSIILGFDDSGSSGGGGAGGPRSIKALAHQIAQIHRYDGVTADFRAAGLESRRARLPRPEPADQRHRALRRPRPPLAPTGDSPRITLLRRGLCVGCGH